MDREPLLRDFDAMHEAGFHHPPADEALQSAERQDADEFPFQSLRDHAAQPEDDERHGEDDADQPAQQPMAPLPEEDEFEPVEAHAGDEFLILRDRLIFGEFGEPIGLGERRQHAGDRLPFGDREAGFREPRRAADDDHGEDQRRDAPEPEAQRAMVARPRRAVEDALAFAARVASVMASLGMGFSRRKE